MREALAARTGGPLRALALVPLAAAALAACRPQTEGGYDKISHRTREEIQAPSNPPPPPVLPGFGSGQPQKIVARNLPAGATQAMVDAGQQKFGTVCAACHGPSGTGTATAPALNDAEWLHIRGDFGEIATIINAGVAQPRQYPAPMPPKGGGAFSDAEVREIAAYVYALSHP